MADSLKTVSDLIESCANRCRTAQSEHTALSRAHDTLAQLHSKIRNAAADGDVDKMRELAGSLEPAHGEARRLHRAVADAHDGISRSLEAAQLAVRAAADEAESAAYIEPTHKTGAQTSDGFSLNGNGTPPRDYSPEGIRQRDQRVGVELGYRAKIEALRGRH
jgi:hypothetical protein